MKLKREPALLIGLVTSVLALLTVKGIMSAEEAAAWGGIITTILPIVQALITRFFVMPVSTIEDSNHSVEEIKAQAARNTSEE